MRIPSSALSTSSSRTLQEMNAPNNETLKIFGDNTSGTLTLPASHYASIYLQRARNNPATSTILEEVGVNLRDFAETEVALLNFEDDRNRYLLFVDSEQQVLAGLFAPKRATAT